MNEVECRRLINRLIERIKDEPDGYNVSTFQLMMEAGIDVEKYDDSDLFKINDALFDMAAKEYILLDMSAHEDMDEGLPYHLDFVVKHPGCIKSVCLTSSKICDKCKADQKMVEVEQKLTITKSGRIWFSAKNYNPDKSDDRCCRKKQLSIGRWKAEFLIRMIENMPEASSCVSDVDSYELEIKYRNGLKKCVSGQLNGNVLSHAYGNIDNVDLTRLFRRYIPIFGLWVFDSAMSPDYEGKKAIYLFAEQWEEFFKNPNSNKDFEITFGEQCERLGFQMDSGGKFISVCENHGCSHPFDEDMTESLKKIEDIDIIGSGLFSYWRELTHWCFMYQLDDKVCGNFLMLLRRIKDLTKKKA